MTQNQVAYFSAKEQQRHNLAQEAEAHRTNVQNEGIKSAEQKATESHYLRSDYESIRSHKASEAISYAQLGEQKRHNTETEFYQWLTAYPERELKEAETAYKQAETGRSAAQTELASAQTQTELTQPAYYSSKTTEAMEKAEYYKYKAEVARKEGNFYEWNLAVKTVDSLVRDAVAIGGFVSPQNLGGQNYGKEQKQYEQWQAQQQQWLAQQRNWEAQQTYWQESATEAKRRNDLTAQWQSNQTKSFEGRR